MNTEHDRRNELAAERAQRARDAQEDPRYWEPEDAELWLQEARTVKRLATERGRVHGTIQRRR